MILPNCPGTVSVIISSALLSLVGALNSVGLSSICHFMPRLLTITSRCLLCSLRLCSSFKVKNGITQNTHGMNDGASTNSRKIYVEVDIMRMSVQTAVSTKGRYHLHCRI